MTSHRLLSFLIFISLLIVPLHSRVNLINLKKIRSTRMISSSIARSTTAGRFLNSTFDSHLFIAKIFLGTPPQTLRVLVDTQRTGLLIFSSSCRREDQYCAHKQSRFNSFESKTFVDKKKSRMFAFKDESSSENSSSGVDVFKLGNLTIHRQAFMLVDDFFESDTSSLDGILGVGKSPKSTRQQVHTPIENLAKLNKIDQAMFSLRLASFDGTLVLGGVNPKYYKKPIIYVPLVKRGNWRFHVTSISMGNESKSLALYSKGALASIDTGASFIGVPKSAFYKMTGLMNAKFDDQRKTYMLDCAYLKAPFNITFKIAQHSFALPVEQFVVRDITSNKDENDLCSWLFMPIKEQFWTIGTGFLEKFYSVYDIAKNRIGFAEYATLDDSKPNMDRDY